MNANIHTHTQIYLHTRYTHEHTYTHTENTTDTANTQRITNTTRTHVPVRGANKLSESLGGALKNCGDAKIRYEMTEEENK